MTPVLKRSLTALAIFAAAAEGAVIYTNWPSPPLKVCASAELGELLAAAAKADAHLHEARARLRGDPNPDTTKEVMQTEAASAAALIEVANFKQRAQDRHKASGAPAKSGSCA